MSRKLIRFVLSAVLSVTLPVSAADLLIKKDIVFEKNDRVFVQGGKIMQEQSALVADKGHCQLQKAAGAAASLNHGLTLKINRMSSDFDKKQVALGLQNSDGSDLTLSCAIPELPSVEQLSAIVLKKVFEDEDWKQRYNQMAAAEQAEAMKVFMARAANQMLDEEFALILMGVAELKF